MNIMTNNVTVVIPTRNRKNELKVALRSILKQTVQSEIIVLDDASTDGTSEMLQKEFTQIMFIRSKHSLGCYTQINVGTKLASNSIVMSIDDDINFVNPTTIEQTLKLFDHPRVASVWSSVYNISRFEAPLPVTPKRVPLSSKASPAKASPKLPMVVATPVKGSITARLRGSVQCLQEVARIAHNSLVTGLIASPFA